MVSPADRLFSTGVAKGTSSRQQDTVLTIRFFLTIKFIRRFHSNYFWMGNRGICMISRPAVNSVTVYSLVATGGDKQLQTETLCTDNLIHQKICQPLCLDGM